MIYLIYLCFFFMVVVASDEVCDPRNYLGYQATTAYNYIQSEGVLAAKQVQTFEEEIVSRNRSSMIVGGFLAEQGQIPWQVGMIGDIYGESNQCICGGSLVSHNRVVSAAHCWNDGHHRVWRYTMVLGSIMLFFGGLRVQTTEYVIHPMWQPSLLLNDVSITYLPYPVQFSPLIAPISLPEYRFGNLEGMILTASGFGVSNPQLNRVLVPGQTLYYQDFEVIPNGMCFNFFPTQLSSNNICTSGAGGRDPCRGDSGSPLALIKNNQAILIGIVSFGTRLGCDTGHPTVYTRVDMFMDFISSHMN